jgi:cell division protein FtsN
VKNTISVRALPNAFWRLVTLLHAVVITAIGLCTSTARAQEMAQTLVVSSVPERPKILPNRRWDEDWSVLADQAHHARTAGRPQSTRIESTLNRSSSD